MTGRADRPIKTAPAAVDDRDMTESIIRAARTATAATLSTLAVIAGPSPAASPVAGQSNADGVGKARAERNRSR